MEVTLTISNYRCFGRGEPARLVLRPGFAAIVGANNAGKSATLRFLWEFRELFRRLSADSGNIYQAIGGVPQAFNLPIADAAELFSDTNSGDLTFVVEINPPTRKSPPLIDKIVVTVPRNTNTFTVIPWIGSLSGGTALLRMIWARQSAILEGSTRPMQRSPAATTSVRSARRRATQAGRISTAKWAAL
jgi:hypothetical protein